MSDAKIRDLFETTIPNALAQGGRLGEGFRCRFHVEGGGAWEIDLRRPPSLIDAHLAMGGYHAVVYASADTFLNLMQSDGANLDELVAMGRLSATGDGSRAFEMTKTIAKGPPFVWPSPSRRSRRCRVLCSDGG